MSSAYPGPLVSSQGWWHAWENTTTGDPVGTQLQGLILLLMVLLLPKLPLAVSTMSGEARGQLWPEKGVLRCYRLLVCS